MIAGIGIDLVEIARIERIATRWGDAFHRRVFTLREIDACSERARPAIHFAARFAVKEALLKSLGLGLGMGVRLHEIETVNERDGRPTLLLHANALWILERRGIGRTHLTITHTKDHAMAVVVLEADGRRPRGPELDADPYE
ncbi:MAG: holo-ACP synthase [Syntrophales bacterium]|jgi:holo-[acyl-carrier protein] synthase|nr:holo-ACP synthase [Syntrophales bacterium]MDD4339145.1 holo-ACP synthase [Syntrophales bacterium]HOG08090.1 holo-ACP synthase [Syntrophales bacterium]HOS77293.1 holo-ACP synthase [Syntrophales bacterium]HPB70065.1 holo-ACP synthase [Syntrophales bacterium]